MTQLRDVLLDTVAPSPYQTRHFGPRSTCRPPAPDRHDSSYQYAGASRDRTYGELDKIDDAIVVDITGTVIKHFADAPWIAQKLWTEGVLPVLLGRLKYYSHVDIDALWGEARRLAELLGMDVDEIEAEAHIPEPKSWAKEGAA